MGWDEGWRYLLYGLMKLLEISWPTITSRSFKLGRWLTVPDTKNGKISI